MDIDSTDFRRQNAASPSKTPLAQSSRKRAIQEVEPEQPASFPSRKRRAISDTSGDDTLVSKTPMEMPLADPSRKRSIEDVEAAPPTTSTPKRRRMSPNSDSYELPLSNPFDPLERSTPSPLLGSVKTPTEDRTTGVMPDPISLGHESQSYGDPTTVVFRPYDTEKPSLGLGAESEALDSGTNPEAANTDDQSTARLRDHDAALDVDYEMQRRDNNGSVPSKPEPQGEHLVHVEEDRGDKTMDSKHLRCQTTSNVIQSNSDRTEQTATSIVIPVQIPQRNPVGYQELLQDGNAMNVPVIRNKRKGGHKPSTKGPKAPQLETQREQGKRKPLTEGRNNWASKQQREQQAYVGRLRSGIGDRKHKEPSK